MAGDRREGVKSNGSRVDMGTVVGGLRHLDASAEPARVFTGLAGVCVPALCDECVIWISERTQHPYRIRRASAAAPEGAAAIPEGMLTAAPADNRTTVLHGSPVGSASVEITDHTVIARFTNPPWGGPDYRGVMVCRWHTAHTPDDAEAALVGILVDHATALVQRERGPVAGLPDSGPPVGTALPATDRIAAASGILMTRYHLSTTQAHHLLSRASEHTRRPVIEISDVVLCTGALPSQ